MRCTTLGATDISVSCICMVLSFGAPASGTTWPLDEAYTLAGAMVENKPATSLRVKSWSIGSQEQ